MTSKELIAEAQHTQGYSEGDLRSLVRNLADALTTTNAALDRIATRVTPDNYDNPSSALEAIEDAVMSTGRTIEGYDDDNNE